MRRAAILLLAAVLGIAIGFWGSRMARAVDQQAIFQAVHDYLVQAHAAPQDMPSKVIAITPLGDGQFRVHMQMKVGEGWFVVTQAGGKWQVRGAQPPATPPR